MTAISTALLLAGCSFLGGFFGSDTPTASLTALAVVAEPQANGNSATALDIVFAYDAAVLPLLPKDGPAWFEQKAGLLSAFPAALDVVSLQLPPAQSAQAVLPKRRGEALRVVAYANYLAAAGQGAIHLTDFKQAVLTLKPAAIETSAK